MRKISYAGFLLIMLGCLACAAPSQPAVRDFAGNWVVDLTASERVNPTLKDREEMREFMSQVVLAIDLDKLEMTIKQAQFVEQRVMPFVILEQAPGMLVLKVDKTELVRLELTGKELTFRVVDDPSNRETFVFVPQGS